MVKANLAAASTFDAAAANAPDASTTAAFLELKRKALSSKKAGTALTQDVTRWYQTMDKINKAYEKCERGVGRIFSTRTHHW